MYYFPCCSDTLNVRDREPRAARDLLDQQRRREVGAGATFPNQLGGGGANIIGGSGPGIVGAERAAVPTTLAKLIISPMALHGKKQAKGTAAATKFSLGRRDDLWAPKLTYPKI